VNAINQKPPTLIDTLRNSLMFLARQKFVSEDWKPSPMAIAALVMNTANWRPEEAAKLLVQAAHLVQRLRRNINAPFADDVPAGTLVELDEVMRP
jgi:hypothetical protein